MWVMHHTVGTKALASDLPTVGFNEGHDSGYYQHHQDEPCVASADMHGCLSWQSADPGSECELVLQVQKAQTLQEVAGLETEGSQ
jgi:hypothetical protein